MELAKIEALIEAYFEGNTSLAEESMLREYFKSEEIASHLQAYKSMFIGFAAAKDEVSVREVEIPSKSLKIGKAWWYSMAASLLVAITVGGFLLTQPSMSQEEKAALAAFQKSKEAMVLLSSNFNKGTEKLVYMNQIIETKNKILK